MLNEMFRKMAVRKLTKPNIINRLAWEATETYQRRHGYITKFSNGTEGFDIVRWTANSMKAKCLFYGAVLPAAAIIGNVLGNMNSKN